MHFCFLLHLCCVLRLLGEPLMCDIIPFLLWPFIGKHVCTNNSGRCLRPCMNCRASFPLLSPSPHAVPRKFTPPPPSPHVVPCRFIPLPPPSPPDEPGRLLTRPPPAVQIYPVSAHWNWSTNGWLSVTNANAILGVGSIDFAGSGVVHTLGGFASLMGSIVLGPRVGRYDPSMRHQFVHGHNPPLYLLGTFLLWLGW